MFDFCSLNDHDIISGGYGNTKNLLQYTLFLDMEREYSQFDDNNFESIIEEIFSQTNEICVEYSLKNTMFGGDDKFTGNDPYQKFDQNAVSLLLRNHCIISALYTAKALYLNKIEYAISPYVAGTYMYDYGYFTMKEILDLKTSNGFIFDKKKKTVGLLYDQPNAKNYALLVKKYQDSIRLPYTYKILLNNNYLIDQPTREREINLFNSDFVYDLINGSTIMNNKIEKMINGECESAIKTANQFSDTLYSYTNHRKCPYEKNAIFYNTDAVLYNYQLERYFSSGLIADLYLYHNCIKREYPVNGEAYHNIISKFALLPNAFSRKYFIRWAFESVSNTFIHDNFWTDIESDYYIIKQAHNPTLSKTDAITKWYELVYNFIIYASKITFPIYEKAYYIRLFEYYKKNYGDKALERMIGDLSNYVGKYYSFLIYDFCDGRFDYKNILHGASHIDVNEFNYKGKSGSNDQCKAYEDFLAHSFINKNNIKKRINIKSEDEAQFYLAVVKNIFSVESFKDFYIDFNKDYFRVSLEKSSSWKSGKDYLKVDHILPYNSHFAKEQISELLKIHKSKN